MLPQYLLKNFIGILHTNCKTGKCAEPVSSHRALFNPVGTKVPHTALSGTEETGHQSQGFLVTGCLLMASSALNIKL